MRTAIVSDLHLGTLAGGDVARSPEVVERLAEALSGVDRIVLLGDLLELRERPVAEVLHLARPVLEAVGEAAAGGRVVIVPGNHDHEIAAPFLARQRLESQELSLAGEWPVEGEDGVAGRIADLMPRAEVSVAYPGLFLRPDVYASHGHYLDLHLTIPRLESIAASAMGRLTGRGHACGSASEYELALSPMYAFQFSLAQGSSGETLARGSSLSRVVWGIVDADNDRPLARFLLGRVTIPGAVAVLNRVGLGPLKADLTGQGLRRAGLSAMSQVVAGLELPAEHVIFGHTHRPGPLEADDPDEWQLPGGSRLWNTGSWFREPAFLRGDADASPYFPGTVVTVEDGGPPRITNALRGRPLPAPPPWLPSR